MDNGELDIAAGIEAHGSNMQHYLKRLKSLKYLILRTFESLSIFGSPDLMKPINEINLERYRLAVHSIMAESMSVCAVKVAGYAKYLENAAGAGDTTYIREFNPAFLACLKRLIAEIDKIAADFDAQNPRTIASEPDAYLLAKLREACRFYNVDTICETMDELNGYQYETGSELINWLDVNVNMKAYGIVTEKLSKQ